MTFPRFIALQSMINSNYLQYRKGEASSLDFNGEYVTSRLGRFEIETPKSGGGGSLFHIRCCYTNKYLVKQSQEEGSLVVATAGEKVEDQSLWSCTLFEPVLSEPEDSNSNQISYFRHVQSPQYVTVDTSKESLSYGFLFATATEPGKDSGWKIVDLDSFIQLPKYVTVASADDGNGIFNAVVHPSEFTVEMHPENEYSVADPRQRMEIVPHQDGSISIKSCYSNLFWRARDDQKLYAFAELEDSFKFRAIEIESSGEDNNKTIILRCLDNGTFCGLRDSVLEVGFSSATKETHLNVSEAVIYRTIYNVRFRLSDARIFNETPTTLDTGEDENSSTTEPSTLTLRFKYSITKSSSWNNSFTGTAGVKTTIDSGIPLIAEGKIELSVEDSHEYAFGGGEDKVTDYETIYQVVAAPLTNVKVTMLGTKGSYEVPFSYTQRDVLLDGSVVITEEEDGVYSGKDCYNFRYRAEKYQLPTTQDATADHANA